MSQNNEKSATEQLAEIQLELAKKELALKDAQLQRELRMLDKTDSEINEYDNRKVNREQEVRSRGQILKSQTTLRRAQQKNCAHRQGGKGVEQMYSSTEQRRSVAKYVLPTGEMVVKCTRCKKEWFPPLPSDYLKPGSVVERGSYKTEVEYQKAIAKNVDRAAYDKANQEYLDACAFDNGGMAVGSSWTNTFSFTREGQDVRREKTHEYVKGAKESAL